MTTFGNAAIGRNQPSGLYDPANEHDACGLGFIANMKGAKSHKIIEDGLRILENLEHRGATGADPLMGDGAGMLVQIPHELFAAECPALGFDLPEAGNYGVGYFFTGLDEEVIQRTRSVIEKCADDEGFPVIGWRDVPTDNSSLSQDPEIMAAEPKHLQAFFRRGDIADDDAFERGLYVLRRVIYNALIAEFGGMRDEVYPVSLSSRTIVYKGDRKSVV